MKGGSSIAGNMIMFGWFLECCGESHTTSLLPVLVVVHLVDFGGDYDRDGLCYVILNSDDFTFNKYFIFFTQSISEDGPLSSDVLF